MKLKSIEIAGIRGIQKDLSISFDNSRSLLLYGDNGSGKSSITDAIEWFLYDKINHLSSGEIGKTWVEALRNIMLDNDQNAYVDLKLSDSKYDSKRILGYKGKKVLDEYSNTTDEFNKYCDEVKKERLILRYKDILRFILYTKSEKLQEISNIIGYSEVTKLKTTLKKAVNELKKELKSGNYEAQRNSKLSLFMTEVKQPIHNDQQYYDVIGKLIEPLNLSFKVNSHENINSVPKLCIVL